MAILEVTVEPSASVTVTSMVVGMVDVAGASEVGVVSVVVRCDVCVVFGSFDVGSIDDGVGSACDVSLVSTLVELVVAEVDATGVLVVPPVPTTCLLLGNIPAESFSARACAKNENIAAATKEVRGLIGQADRARAKPVVVDYVLVDSDRRR